MTIPGAASVAAATLLSLASASCVEPYKGTETGTGTATTTSGDTTATTTTTSTATTGTTEGPTSGSDSESSATTTTSDPGPGCGNGVVEMGEECDDGDANADNAACTSRCTVASCGDSYVHDGVELCDDGDSNGQYGFCNTRCSGLGPRCGDTLVQAEYGEECDNPEITSGCLSTCVWARRCQEIKNDEVEGLADGLHEIYPDGMNPVEVFCDLETDEMRGFTYLKYHAYDDENPELLSASAAEERCADHKLKLLVPRDSTHLTSAWRVATMEAFAPVGGGSEETHENYMQILGIYPVEPGVSCPGKPFNSDECPEWKATDNGQFHASSVGLDNKPGTSNCDGCSASYSWNGGQLTGLEVFQNGGNGATSEMFLCVAEDD